MKTFDEQLKLQAWLDGELPEAEAREVAQLVERDAEAQALVTELRWAREAIRSNEPQMALPESREFFWSKIEREIQRQTPPVREATVPAWVMALRRWLVPVAGVAAVALMFVHTNAPQAVKTGEAETPTVVQSSSDQVGAMTYRDQQEGITMVWLYDRTAEPFTEAAPADTMDPE